MTRWQGHKSVLTAVFSLAFDLVVAAMLSGCAGKADRIMSLARKGQLNEAQSIVNQLTPSERQSPEISSALKELDFAVLVNQIPSLDSSLGFLATDSIISSRSKSFRDEPNLADSLAKIRRANALDGARHLYANGDVSGAYSLVADYVSDYKASESQGAFIDTLRERLLTGIWLGEIPHVYRVKFVLTALTPSVFSGVMYRGDNYPVVLEGGFFDGRNLTASCELIEGGSVSGYYRVLYYVKGRFEHGKLRIGVPVGNNFVGHHPVDCLMTEISGYTNSSPY